MAEQKEECDLPGTKINDEECDLPGTNGNDEELDNEKKKSVKVKKSKTKIKDSEANEDEELSELLDSALEDFVVNDNNDEKKTEEIPKPTPPNSLWDDEFLKQAAEKLQQSIQSGFSAGDTPLTAEQLGQNIQSLAEAVTQMAGGAEASPDMEFSNFFAQALKEFSETSQLSQRPLSEDDLRSMMSNLSNCFDSPEFNEFLPIISTMMQNLLSKDVLYGDLKGITEKYPQWLEENKAKLPSQEYDRHTKKLEILRSVCSELEKESPNDTEDAKKARFDRIFMLMLQIQDLGPLPSEITGDLDPALGLDSHENAQLPSNSSPDQCRMI